MQTSSESTSIRTTPAAMLLLVGLTLAVFWPVVSFEFLNWDDRFHLLDNPLFQPPSIENIRHYWTQPYMGLYIPLTYTIWTLIGTVSMNPAVFHAANLLAHLGCVLLVFTIVRRLIGSIWPAAIGAAIFAVHPLQVETVAWVSGFRDLLGAMLLLLSVVCYMRHARRSVASPNISIDLLLCILCFTLALLAKPTTIVAPLIIVVIARLMNRRWNALLIETAPLFALAIGCAIWTRTFQPSLFLEPAPLGSRPLVVGDALAFYLFKLFKPVELCFDYGRTPQAVILSGQAMFTWIAPVCLLLACALTFRRQRFATATLLICVAGLLPVLGIVPFDFQDKSTVADRYVYVSMLGVAIGIAAIVQSRDSSRIRAVAAIAIVALGVTSWIQTWTWRNTRTMAAHGLAINPRSFSALDLLAWGAFDDKNNKLAERLSRESRDIRRQNQTALINLGRALVLQNRAAEALEPMELAVKLRDGDAEAHANLGLAYGELGRIDDAIRECEKAIQLNPNHRPAKLMLPRLRERQRRQPSTTRSSE